MGRAPGVDQTDALAGLAQLHRRPGAEHAGADDEHVEPGADVLGSEPGRQRGGDRRTGSGKEQGTAVDVPHRLATIRSRSASSP